MVHEIAYANCKTSVLNSYAKVLLREHASLGGLRIPTNLSTLY